MILKSTISLVNKIPALGLMLSLVHHGVCLGKSFGISAARVHFHMKTNDLRDGAQLGFPTSVLLVTQPSKPPSF